MTQTISKRGTLKFTFPAHASPRAMRQLVERIVGEAQQRIDAEEERERTMARVRDGVRKSGLVARSNFTLPEAARELGMTEANVRAAVLSRRLNTNVVGYVEHITKAEIESFKQNPDLLWFLRIERPGMEGRDFERKPMRRVDAVAAGANTKARTRRAA